jgi:hypothetical protein
MREAALLRRAYLGPRPARFHDGRDASTWAKITLHYRPHRIAGLHHVVQYLIHNVFLKDAEIPVAKEIFLIRFQFQALLIRHIAKGNHTKIGQPRLGTHGGKLRVIDHNFVTGKLVLPGLNRRKRPAFACSSVYRWESAIWILYGTGGGADYRARFLAKHSKHIS